MNMIIIDVAYHCPLIRNAISNENQFIFMKSVVISNQSQSGKIDLLSLKASVAFLGLKFNSAH